MPQIPKHAPVVLFGALIGISVSGPLVRLSTADPLAIASWRLGLSMVCICLCLAVSGTWREFRSLARGDLLAACAAGGFLALHFWSWLASIGMTTVAASVVLVNLHPVFVAAGSVAFLHERPSNAQIAGIAIALLGALVLASGDFGSGGSLLSSRALLGDGLAVVGAITVSGYLLAGRRVRTKLSLWPYVALVYGVCFVIIVALALLRGVPLTGYPSRELSVFAAMALGPMMLGHTSFNWALRYVPAYMVSLIALMEPVGATAIAWVLPAIHEVPSALVLIGGAVMIVGMGVTAASSRE
jgi:drug/metabolite transporter (DMT)-like permease